MIISGKARVAGVLGWPVDHSASPRLHGYWLDRYGLDGAYVPLAVRPEDFERALRMLPKLGFIGANITVPHKEQALAAVDEATPQARIIGAVNTVVVQPDGSLEGRNTDAFGFLENLKAAVPGWHAPHNKPAVVIGAGGAARAVVAALLEAGFLEIHLVNRTAARAQALAEDMGKSGGKSGGTSGGTSGGESGGEPGGESGAGSVTAVPWEARSEALEHAALLVNTTTLGMVGQPQLDLDLERLARRAVVADIVYTPLETPLLRAAAARGNPTVDGLGMLIHQARPGFEAWFGTAPEVTAELRAFLAAGLGR